MSQPQPPGGISFKTVPGRHRTQKWNKAPVNTYDGDDWGGYDPYDEYGNDEEPPPLPSAAQASTLPSQRARQRSFDRGDDGARSVSSPFPAPPSITPVRATPIGSNTRPRDFTNPEQVPPPLMTRESPAPAGWFPPRKSSMSGRSYDGQQQAAEAAAMAQSVVNPPTSTPSSPSSPQHFVRPSDIYKRVPEERARASEDGGRPSVDILQKTSPAEHKTELPPVQETRASHLGLPGDVAKDVKDTSPQLPLVTRFSGFGDDFLTQAKLKAAEDDSVQTSSSSIQATPITTKSTPAEDGLQHQSSVGFRSAVSQAFDSQDATLSRDNSGSATGGRGVGRSDTSSTAGISPIMSRVPSSAAAAFQQRQAEGHVPPIAEEVSPTASTPDARVPRKPSPGSNYHAPAEFTPGYRRSLDPPSTGTSPARTPAVESIAGRRLSRPMSAEIGDDGSDADAIEPVSGAATSAPVPIVGRGRSGTDYSTREADLVDTINSSPEKYGISAELAEVSRENQDMFLKTHNTVSASATPPNIATADSSRANSPAKGRVREIAGKFQKIENASRRNSAASIASSKSSWSRFGGGDDEKPRLHRANTNQSYLGQKTEPEVEAGSSNARQEITREASFRPDVPGGWINSSVPTPAAEDAPTTMPFSQPVDLAPTTQKHQLPSRDPVLAAKEVGDELAASIVSTYGIGHQTRDFASGEPPAPVDQPETTARPEIGDVTLRPPLISHETGSSDAQASITSSIPPTPPEKATPRPGDSGLSPDNGAGHFHNVAPLRVRSREPSPEHSVRSMASASVLPPHRRSSSDSAGDEESDRLRREIEDSLVDDTTRTQDALDAPDNARRIELGLEPSPAAQASATSVTPTHPQKLGLLATRFSWEKPTPQEQESPEIKPEMAYERPRTSKLHVMNAQEGDISPISPMNAPPAEPSMLGGGPLSVPDLQRPEAAAAEAGIVRSLSQRARDIVSPISTSEPQNLHTHPETVPERANSPISDTSRIPSYYAESSTQEGGEPGVTMTSPSRPRSAGQIQPFRQILQLKSADERIKTYEETRQTFADMNTGLSSWLSSMSSQHPDVAKEVEQGRPPPLTAASLSSSGTNTWKRGHRPAPSLANFKNRFASGSSATDAPPPADPGPSGLDPSDTVRPTTGSGGTPVIDMDRVQQKSKVFIKNAGMFGGKASAGAKGLLAKGKSRFGGSVRGKNSGEDVSAPSSPPTSRKRSSSRSSPVKNVLAFRGRRTVSSPLVQPLTAPPIAAPPTAITVGEDAEEGKVPLESRVGRRPSSSPAVPAAEGRDRTAVASDAVRRSATGDEQTSDPRLDLIDSGDRGVTPGVSGSPASSSRTPNGRDKASLDAVVGSADHDISPLPAPKDFTSTSSPRPPTIPGSLPSASTPNLTSVGAIRPPSAFEKRPDLSRQVSANSSPRRDRSTTPASSMRSSGRPFSQVFERLRNKSRSMSRTRGEESRSRPASLVLSQSNLLSDEGLRSPPMESQAATHIAKDDVFVLSDFSDVAVDPSAFATSPEPTPTSRIEAWNSPGAQVPIKQPSTSATKLDSEKKVKDAQRIGILPSPAPTATTFAEADRLAGRDQFRRRNSAAAWKRGLEDQYGDKDERELAVVPSAVPSEDGEMETMAVDDKENQPPMNTTTEGTTQGLGLSIDKPHEQSEEMKLPPSPTKRPPQQRKVSDITTLPSQQRRASQGHQSLHTSRPTSMAGLPNASATSPILGGSLASSPAIGTSSGSRTASHSRKGSLAVMMPSPMNHSQVSGFSDVEFAEASPVTLTTGEATLLNYDGDTPTTPVRKSAHASRVEAGEQTSKGTDDVASGTPTSRGGALAGIIASATERSEKRKLSEAQPNPYVLSPLESDSRSEVSAVEGGKSGMNDRAVRLDSRRSSVSSITPREVPPQSTNDASASPPQSSSGNHARPSTGKTIQPRPLSQYEQRFANRLYAQNPQQPGKPDRPLSYIPLSREGEEYTQFEQISAKPVVEKTVPVEVDLSAISGPPAGTPPFQQHPVFRNSAHSMSVQLTEYERMRSTSRQSGVLTSPGQTPVASPEEKRASRFGGFFGARKEPAPMPAAPGPVIPGRELISDAHGLEGIHAWGYGPHAATTPGDGDAQDPLDASAPASSQLHASPKGTGRARRKSGIWRQALHSRKSSGVQPKISPDEGEEGLSTVPPLASLENADVTPPDYQASAGAGGLARTDTGMHRKGNVLQKVGPARASSSAVRLDGEKDKGKKKRFSGLKSLLGRSTTSATPSSSLAAGATAGLDRQEANKLRKTAPPVAMDSTVPSGGDPQLHTRQQMDSGRPTNPATIMGRVSGYAEYEAARKNEMRSQQRTFPPPTQVSQPTMDEPGPDGWAAPRRMSTAPPAAIQPTYERQPMPEFRRLHSEGRGRGHGDVTMVPEVLRPGEPGTNNHRNGWDAVTLPGPGPLDRQPTLPVIPDDTPAISGRSQFWPRAGPGHRPFESVSEISPISPRDPPPNLPSIQTQSARVVSRGTEVARSPAKEYPDQQTPYPIALPPTSNPPQAHARSMSLGSEPKYADPQRGMYYPQQQQQQQQQHHHHPHHPRGMSYSAESSHSNNQWARSSQPPQQHWGSDARIYSPPPQDMAGSYATANVYSADPQQSQAQQRQYEWMSRSVYSGGPASGNTNDSSRAPVYQPTSQQWLPRSRPSQPPPSQQRYYAHAQPQYYDPQLGVADPRLVLPRELRSPPLSGVPPSLPPHPLPHPHPHQQRPSHPAGRSPTGGYSYDAGPYAAASPPPPPPPPPAIANTPAGFHRRRPSAGYTGRRDDPAVGEDELIMRGASYPGQEWEPSGLGRERWD